jgi:[ribosomal protein S18]-alanine N-acetyltransferase
LAFYIRAMTRQDLSDVTEIDREAFPMQWPPADYGYEFKNHMAHYMVSCDSDIVIESEPEKPGKLKNWFRGLFSQPKSVIANIPPHHYIAGFIGFWIMAGESHITSIAVRQKYRRKGIGEMMLIKAIEQSIELKAEFVTLEVRASNTGAQALYKKLGFEHVGERRKYYLDRGPNGDTREDALIMTTKDIRTAEFQNQLQQLKERKIIKSK